MNIQDATKHPFETEAPVCPLRKCDMKSCHQKVGRGWDFEYHSTYKEIDFLQCKKCQLIFPEEIPSESSLSLIYPSNYYSFSETKKPNRVVRVIRGWMAEKKGEYYKELVKSSNANVLDVGCGDGRLIEILESSCPNGWNYTGIDWSDQAISELKNKGHEGRSGDVNRMDLSDWEGKFDLIIMHQLIEHVHDPRSLLEKLGKVLNKGGVISIETPDIDSWDFRLLHDRYWSVYHIPRHFYIFNKKNFGEMAHDAGFEVVSAKSLVNPVAWIHSIKSYCEDVRLLRPFSKFFHHQNIILLAIFTPLEILQILISKTSSNMQINLKKVG